MSEFIKSIKLKLIIIFLLPAVGMLYFSFGYVHEKISMYQNTRYLEKIVEYVKISSSLISELQRERGLSIAFISKESSYFYNELKKQRIKSDEAFIQFNALLKNYTELYDEKDIKTILEHYTDIRTYRKNIDNKTISIFDVLNFYSKIVTNLIESTDVLKAQFINKSFFNLIVCFNDLLKLTEVSGKERAIVSYILETENLTPKLYNILLSLEIEYKELKKRFLRESSIQALALYNNKVNTAKSDEILNIY
ncbi:nitrate- and nitrite sensing domain-containing protein [Hydrogenimonas thermophila]|uniref:Nitrate and nitrite sensing n=1 Tax=Hydrogenimonas thermophila TaxID=223786 RepID=A0A1I5R8I7_9BACT|nr:nitrate- and nitrite sensing domain-containing protein [Hydrogenimonas thermophila]SFP54844.1 Nitrate and nitrite sensing [Hydrogenimonas thermophila]